MPAFRIALFSRCLDLLWLGISWLWIISWEGTKMSVCMCVYVCMCKWSWKGEPRAQNTGVRLPAPEYQMSCSRWLCYLSASECSPRDQGPCPTPTQRLWSFRIWLRMTILWHASEGTDVTDNQTIFTGIGWVSGHQGWEVGGQWCMVFALLGSGGWCSLGKTSEDPAGH